MSSHHRADDSVAMLSSVSFFDGFSEEDIRQVVAMSDHVKLLAGSVLVDQGDPGSHCYVIVEGSASVYVRGEHIAGLGPGSMVGEMALVDHRPRSATVVADTDLELIRFDSKAFRQLLDDMPKASERIMKLLHTRMSQG